MSDSDLLRLSAQIVSAHVEHNSVHADDLPAVIRTVYDTLARLAVPESAADLQVPAVPIKKSVFPSYIVCLEDGKKLKMLKRYLMTNFSMTPDDYRAKWGLPDSYPMVAPEYAQMRSGLAKRFGLGGRRSSETHAPEVAEGIGGKKRGRKRVADPTAAAPLE